VALLSVAVIWGLNVPIMKVALAELNPYGFNAARLTLSALLLGLVAYLEGSRIKGVPLGRALWMRIVAVSMLGSLAYQVLFISGVWRTTAGNVGIIIATAPIWTAVVGYLTGIERIRMSAWAGLGLAFVGATLVTIDGGNADLGGATLIGNLVVLCAAMTWATFTVMSKPLVSKLSPTGLAFRVAMISLPFHLLIGFPHMGPIVRMEISTVTWGCIVFSGLLSTGLAYALWNYGIHHSGPSGTAIYTNLVPVITLATGVWLLGERITRWQVVGGALVLGGLVWMQRFRGRPVRTPPV